MYKSVRLLLVATLALAGCASWKHDPSEPVKPMITLSDTNNDGIPDVARFRYTEFSADGDYELLDKDYDGYFDTKVIQGYDLQEQPLKPEIPVQQIEQQAKGK